MANENKDSIAELLTAISKLPANLIGMNVLLLYDEEDNDKSFAMISHKGTSLVFKSLNYKTVDDILQHTKQYMIPADIITKAPKTGIEKVVIKSNKLGIKYGDGIALSTKISEYNSTNIIKNIESLIKIIDSINDDDWIKLDHDLLTRYGGVTRIIASKDGVIVSSDTVAIIKEDESSDLVVSNANTIDAIRAVVMINKSDIDVAMVNKNIVARGSVGDIKVYNTIGNPAGIKKIDGKTLVENAKYMVKEENSKTIVKNKLMKLLPESRKLMNRFGRISDSIVAEFSSDGFVLTMNTTSTSIRSAINESTGIKGKKKYKIVIPSSVLKFSSNIDEVEKIRIVKAETWHSVVLVTDEGFITYKTRFIEE